MECPNCNRHMTTVKTGTSYGHSGKKYDTVQYRCMSCDTWANIETPQEEK